MYVDEPGSNSAAGSGWQVEPEQVREFAAAVAEVRADLDEIFAEVAELTSPAYLPMLGTSPVGQQLAEKFNDRLASESGLKGQLETALQRMEEFVSSAERTANHYEQSDTANAQRYGA
ncbi:hypothetical protein V5P93_001029 [Actinokineospora auranticolor]|uniref:Excreted virulence factor EspC (Type VII ESX diderm) n=1 Tax=Actinokineospora auranticolor TaxID=155976 RepID=A0A2S6GXZ9_9PSEU|nr:hypothetical protein [Actinokineospora auranticolor]PPK70093.1 hypothetical protein CLV40_1023 [Actinokineospora auranticolor]